MTGILREAGQDLTGQKNAKNSRFKKNTCTTTKKQGEKTWI
jgi:hypothetical protein